MIELFCLAMQTLIQLEIGKNFYSFFCLPEIEINLVSNDRMSPNKQIKRKKTRKTFTFQKKQINYSENWLWKIVINDWLILVFFRKKITIFIWKTTTTTTKKSGSIVFHCCWMDSTIFFNKKKSITFKKMNVFLLLLLLLNTKKID